MKMKQRNLVVNKYNWWEYHGKSPTAHAFK